EVLVMEIEDRFNDVRKRTVTDVVQKRRNPDRGPVAVIYFIAVGEFGEDPGREVKSSQTVRKSRMLGPLISKVSQPQLPDPPQPLRFGCVDQPEDEPTHRTVCPHADTIMYRVSVNSLLHGVLIAIRIGG